MRTVFPGRLALLLVVALVVAACGGNSGTATPDDSAPDVSDTSSAPASSDAPEEDAGPGGEATRLRLALHWTYPVGEWDGIITAAEKGYYADAGLDVELQYLAGSTATVQAVGAGESDLGIAGPDTILNGLAQGVDLTVVANHLQVTSSGVIAPRQLGITGPADLEGLTISTAAASPEQAMLQAMLFDVGLDIKDDVSLTYVDPQAKCTVVLSGGADVCTGQNNHHPFQLEDQGVEVDFLSFSSDEVPVLGHSIFAGGRYLEENPEATRAFLEATMRGYQEAHENYEATVDLYVQLRPETDAEFLLKTLKASHQLMYSPRTDEHGWGWMTEEAWQGLYESLLEAEVIEGEVDLSQIFTNEYLPEDAWKPQPVEG